MRKLVKVSSILLVTGIVSGCASTSDIDLLNSRIDALDNRVSKVAADVSSVKSAANEANSRAAAAEAAANRAASFAQDTNSKLDNMFKKSMMK